MFYMYLKNIPTYHDDQNGQRKDMLDFYQPKTEVCYNEKLHDFTYLRKILQEAQPGDCVAMYRFAFLGSSDEERLETYMAFVRKDVTLVFMRDPMFNSANYSCIENQVGNTEVIRSILRSILDSEMQTRRYLIEKSKAERKARGRIGQEKGVKLMVHKQEPAMVKLFGSSISFGGPLEDPECMKEVGVSRNTFYKYKHDLKVLSDGTEKEKRELLSMVPYAAMNPGFLAAVTKIDEKEILRLQDLLKP